MHELKLNRLGPTINGAVANLAAQGIPFLLLLIVTPILLHALGRERYGALILFNLVPQIAGQLDLGLSTAAARGFTRYCARDEAGGARRLFREALTLLLVWGIVVGTVFYAFHATIGHAFKLDTIVPEDSLVYIAAALSIPIALANSVVLVPLRALERYGAVARVQVFSGVMYWLACASWATVGASLAQLVTLGFVIVAITTAAFYFVGLQQQTGANGGVRREGNERLAATVDVTLTHTADDLSAEGGGIANRRFLLLPYLRLGGGAFLAQASSLATYHADKLLVSAFVSPAAAGAYAICTSIANKILLVIASGATFTFPRSARLHAAGGIEGVQATYAFGTRMSILISAALATPLVALAPSFLSIWIGAAFAADYSLVLRVLTMGYAITTTAVVASNIAVGIGEVALPATFALTGGAVTLLGVTLLVPRVGVDGAALAALIGMSQAIVFNDLISRRLGGEARAVSWRLVTRVLVVALVVGSVTAALGAFVEGWLTLLALAALSLLVFAALWLLTFGRDSEQALLSHLMQRVRGLDHVE